MSRLHICTNASVVLLQDPHLQYSLPPMSQAGAGMKRNAEGTETK